ncbi:MAG: KamA family radical SAM protein [Candidatus Marinimicrobia bacterium]|nr:KamA family radical SAM protein [Candidatus Neomarinimicrobiota bacterium]
MKREVYSEDDDVPLVPEPGGQSLPFDFFAKQQNAVSFFYSRFFPGSTPVDWQDWKWQIKHSIHDLKSLERIFSLTNDEKLAFIQSGLSLPVRITPYYAALMYGKGVAYPLRKAMIPRKEELTLSFGESGDPLHEDEMTPVPNIVHRYPDRVLFMVTDFCGAYCRYCTRHRLVGQERESFRFTPPTWEKGIAYIQAHPEIRDVIISGGDPLTLDDFHINGLLSRLRAIPHVQMLRIGTKVPAVLPQRITPSLIKILKKYHPLYMSLHFTHPDEMTPETNEACIRLADAGIPLGSQTVLLKDINNNADVLKELFHKLLQVRVKPYYLYQCDPVAGSIHFRTPVQEGLDIMANLRGFTSGYAVPTYVIDAPGGGGKIPLFPNCVESHDDHYIYLKNYEQKIFRYPDPKKQ